MYRFKNHFIFNKPPTVLYIASGYLYISWCQFYLQNEESETEMDTMLDEMEAESVSSLSGYQILLALNSNHKLASI